MTVNYNLCVSNSSPFSLLKLLWRWKGSVWKAVWVELVIWLLLFNLISLIYRFVLTKGGQENFESIIDLISNDLGKLRTTMDFMLGFFVSKIVDRWGILFANIGFIDTLAITVAGYLTGRSDQERLWRRNIVRHCVLSQVLVLRDISMQVRNRFPTIDTVVAAGIMMPHEREKFDELDYNYGKPWMPIQWTICALQKARAKGSISSDHLLEKCCEQIRNFRSNLAALSNYDWVPLPILYPQIIFLAYYIYFALSLIGFQTKITNREGNKFTLGAIFPLMSALQFLLYIGWLKVSEALLNPLGEDDDDFETNFLIDRNLAVGLAIVDKCFDDPPEEQTDIFWSSQGVVPLYSELSATRHINPMTGSAAAVELPEDVETVNMVARQEDGGEKTTISVRRASTSTIRNESLRQRKSYDVQGHENHVSTINEIEMDEISLNSSPEKTISHH